jgi:nucleoside-diphosphate-sugar epimerase
MEDGYSVRCLARSSSDTSLLEELDVEIVVGDLTLENSLARAAEGCRYVLHCAALVSDWATRGEIERVNVFGTHSILAASLDASVERFIHFSTTDVYGYPGGAAIDESHVPDGFRNWYAQTKLQAEAEVRRAVEGPTARGRAGRGRAGPWQAGQERGMEAVILRPATVYGPGSTAVIGEIARAIRSRSMLLIDRGRAVAGLCYVENLLDAAILALGHEQAPGHAFNVSDGLPITWRELTDGLAEGLDCPRVRFSLPYWLANGIGLSLELGYRFLRRTTGLHAPPLLSRQAVHVLGIDQDFSNAKAREMLGWEPRVDYPAGLRETVAWLRSEQSAEQ